MTFDWIITFISAEETVGQNNLPKISFVLEENTDKEYKWSVSVDILWEKVELIKQYKVWDAVTAHLNFRANEYNGKRYNRVSAWRIEGATAAAPATEGWEKTEDLPF